MANSKKVLLPILAALLIAAAVLTVNVGLMRAYREANSGSYLAAAIDKNKLLAETASPKIIIVGGSNAAFGFDSAAISEATGMPVVNMGLQGSLGLRWPLNDIKPYIHEGDIVLLSPEYHNLLSRLQGGDVLAQVLIFYPRGVTSLSSANDVLQVLQSLPNIHTTAIKDYLEVSLRGECDFLCHNDEYVYLRRAFNPVNGDIKTNRVKDSNEESDFLLELPWSVPNGDLESNVRFLNSFNDYVEAQGASMYYVPPSVSDNYNPSTGETLEEAQQYLQEHLTFPTLGSLADSIFQRQYLFDTPYHLNSDGRAVRTQMVIDDLCAVLEGGCVP
jgi:hypothetical protein